MPKVRVSEQHKFAGVELAATNDALYPDALAPNDPMFPDQEFELNRIGAPDAWEVTVGGQGMGGASKESWYCIVQAPAFL